MIIKSSLYKYVLDLVNQGVLRVSLYIVLRNLFKRYGFQEIQQEIRLQLKFGCNVKSLKEFWEVAVAEFFRSKKDF